MKTGKLIGVILALIIVAVIAVIVAGLSNINAIIKQAVESAGTQAVQTSVTLEAADFKITEGRGELRGLRVANPKGFNSDHAFTLNTIALAVEPASLAGDVIVIREVLIDGVDLVAEQKGLTDNNLQILLNNIKQSTAQSTGGSGSGDHSGAKGGQENSGTQGERKSSGTKGGSENSDSGSAASTIRLMVESFSFTNATMKLITDKWGEKTLALPAIKLKNIGDKTTGLAPEQLAQAVIEPLLKQAKKAAGKALEDKAKERLRQELTEKLSDKDKEKLQVLKSILGK